APIELVQLGGMQGVLVDHTGRRIDDAAPQVLHVGAVVFVITQGFSPNAGFADGHATWLVDQGIPVVGALAEAVIPNTGGTGDASGLMPIGLLLAGNDDFATAYGDIFYFKTGVVLQPVTDVRPVNLLTTYAHRQRLACFRIGIKKLSRLFGRFQVGLEG